jgi:FkbM family methyltransferase
MDKHLNGKRTCIQAGGAIGIWPMRLAQYFDNVYTFEPEPINYECLIHNTAGIENIYCENAALGNENKKIKMFLPSIGHCGAWIVQDNGPTPMLRIDELDLKDVDLIYLDIEGYEYYALEGAAETIRKYKPVIGLEDKGLNRHFDERQHSVKLLEKEFGYKSIGRPQKTDIMLIHETSASRG